MNGRKLQVKNRNTKSFQDILQNIEIPFYLAIQLSPSCRAMSSTL